jgi:hypothetical protein
MRVENIKIAFMEQMSPGTYDVWTNEFRNLRVPLSYNLRADPFEFASITSNTWWEGQMKNTFYLYPALDYASQFLATFKDFPPRHPAAYLTMRNAIDRIKAVNGKEPTIAQHRDDPGARLVVADWVRAAGGVVGNRTSWKCKRTEPV